MLEACQQKSPIYCAKMAHIALFLYCSRYQNRTETKIMIHEKSGPSFLKKYFWGPFETGFPAPNKALKPESLQEAHPPVSN